MVSGMTDEEIWQLRRGGHDPRKVYAAYRAAVQSSRAADRDPRQDHQGLWDGRRRRGHEHHPSAEEDGRRGAAGVSRSVRDPGPRRRDRRGAVLPARRGQRRDGSICASAARALGGYLRSAGARRRSAAGPRASRVRAPARKARRPRDLNHDGVRAHPRTLLRDKKLGTRVVPIVPDESRTFGMEGMFRQLGIFSQVGQLYKPEDAGSADVLSRGSARPDLQEGINEAGAMSSWIAAATSYSAHNMPMIPFYIFYSMFGFQRVGDLAWAAGDRAPRLPARRHFRPHHAQRRRPAARGRPQPRPRLDHPQLRRLRSDVRVRTRGDHPRRAAPDAGASRKTFSTTSPDERELRPSRDARGRRGRDSQGHVPVARTARERRRDRASRGVQLLGSGTILREALAAAELLRTISASRATCGACRASPNCGATESRSSAGTCCIRQAAAAQLRRDLSRRPPGAGGRRDRLYRVVRRSDPALRAAPLSGPGHRRLRPQSDYRRELRSFFEVTGTTSRSPPWPRSLRTGRSQQPRSLMRFRDTESIPTSPIRPQYDLAQHQEENATGIAVKGSNRARCN